MKEIWKPIEGFEGLYEVSNLGNVKALDRYVMNNGGMQHKHERILKPSQRNNKHLTVVLCKDAKTYTKLVHRLVANAFIPNPENKPNVDHIDTNPHNNCADNLRWVTQQENAMNPLTRKHISESKMGHEYWGRKLTEEERQKISNAHKGRKFTEEHKKKLSESHKGIKPSEKNLKMTKGKHWKVEGGKRVWY